MEKEKQFTNNNVVNLAVSAILEHKVIEPILINLKGSSSLADWFLVLSAEGSRQINAVAENIIRKIKENGLKPLAVEGLNDAKGQWILIDLGDVIVHLFTEDIRHLYNIEGLWLEAQQIKIENRDT